MFNIAASSIRAQTTGVAETDAPKLLQAFKSLHNV